MSKRESGKSRFTQTKQLIINSYYSTLNEKIPQKVEHCAQTTDNQLLKFHLVLNLLSDS